jgi:flagellar biogenesis protein FliO
MNSEATELTIIVVALVFFLALCVIAVWLFVRQYRREHPRDDRPRD